MKSWKTTAVAVAAAIGAVLAAVVAILDDDPSTVADWGIVAALGATAIGMFFAKDSSE